MTTAMTTTLMPPADRLLGLSFFCGLDAAALSRVSAGVNEVNARGGTVICRRGEACRCLYIVVHGQVKLILETPQGGEKVVELVGPGGCFGGSSIVLDRSHALTAEALTDSRLVMVAKATVLAELERTPEFTRAIIGSLSHRLQFLIGALEDCMLRSGTERVIGYLLNQLPAGSADGNGTVTLPTKKGVIASQLNLTHEHFSRILRDLATDGLIEVEGRNVRMPDLGRLRARLNGARRRRNDSPQSTLRRAEPDCAPAYR
mgnify:CR=1 FL=1